MQLHLTRVIRRDKDKYGNPLKTKAGKPYERLSIQAEEYPGKWISGFCGPWNDDWNEGDIVNAKVEENGQYLNVSKEDPMEAIESRLKKLEDAVFGGNQNAGPDDAGGFDDDEPPF